MAMFSIEEVGTIEYDFNGWGIPDSGRIPEPSRHVVSKVMKTVQEIFATKRQEDFDPEDHEAVKNALENLAAEEAQGIDIGEMTDALIDPLAELCGGDPNNNYVGAKPSRDSIDRLPFRILMGFMSYVLAQVTDPEVSTAGSRNSSQPSIRRSTSNTTPTRRLRKV